MLRVQMLTLILGEMFSSESEIHCSAFSVRDNETTRTLFAKEKKKSVAFPLNNFQLSVVLL